jgi:hypothetical protein
LPAGRPAYIVITKSEEDSKPGSTVLPGMEELVLKKRKVIQMLDVPNDLRSRQILAIVFAVLSGASAISTAVLPAILHV